MKQRKKQSGSVTLETAIILPIFVIMFMAVIGLFRVVVAQNQMTHVLVQTTKSLSLDSYFSSSLKKEQIAEILPVWGGISDLVLDVANNVTGDDYFTSNETWYEGSGNADSIARDRFIGYLSGGDKGEGQEKLEGLGIVNGLNGLKVKAEVQGEELSVTITYEIQYWFDMFGMGKIPMKQTMHSRMWM